jgi:hypothetical protein
MEAMSWNGFMQMKTYNKTMLMLSVLWVAAGCTFVKPPSRGEYSAITQGQKSLVLLRVTCQISSESGLDPVQGCIKGENASIALGDFESGGKLERILILKSLSVESREQGWIYATLEPGIHYIAFQGQRRTDALTYEAQLQNAQRFRFDIQPNSPIVYIGTMHLECHSDWFLFGAKYCCYIYNQQISNEEKLARKLVSENLNTLGKPKTSLMQAHTEKTLIFRTPQPKK